MDDERRCESCGEPVPADAPGGGCPRCLLAAGLEPGEEPFPRERLAVAFPGLDIEGMIGRGGMGVVYRARQRSLDRVVALKILPPEVAEDPAFADRFTREARALARLSHPHIVAVHEAGEADGLYYLVMELVDGPNLREAQAAGRLAPEEALAIVPQICDALQYAHDQGVVHRDVKPENILLDRGGRVKIADFGLAKILRRSSEDRTLTGTDQVMGTLHYMAPEQMTSPLEVDHRADIYSLGVVFYEMLTG
jgi:serine/threonine protein kinase